MEDGYGPSKREDGFKEYVGKWILIYPQGIPIAFGGQCINVDGDYAILNPFQGRKYSDEGDLVRKMVKGNSRVPLIGSAVEPSTKKDIENACVYANLHNDESNGKTKKKGKDQKTR